MDAAAAARAVLAGQATALPKAGSAGVEMLRCLRVVRATAVKARTQALNALNGLLVTAPVELRERLRGLPAASSLLRRPGCSRARWRPRLRRSVWLCDLGPAVSGSERGDPRAQP